MNITEIKDLMAQFDQSSLREFSYKQGGEELQFSKNDSAFFSDQTKPLPPFVTAPTEPLIEEVAPKAASLELEAVLPSPDLADTNQGDVVESPLVGVAYLAAGPEKPAFVSVGETVKKGQTLLIIEAMKVMNEIPAPKDGVVTEILVENEEMVEFGKGLVRIK